MWNIRKASPEEASSSTRPSMMMNPYEVTKQELMKKLKFFGVYIAGLVVVPQLLRSVGVLEPAGDDVLRYTWRGCWFLWLQVVKDMLRV
jgi:hypothetical protein